MYKIEAHDDGKHLKDSKEILETMLEYKGKLLTEQERNAVEIAIRELTISYENR